MQCPICRSPWSFLPQLAADVQAPLAGVVCPSCWNCFLFDPASGQWQRQPPRPLADRPPPIAFGTRVTLRNIAYRVAGFASYSQSVEAGRDQWQTLERHEYTLTPETAGAQPAILGWDDGRWWVVRPTAGAPLERSSDRSEIQFQGKTYRQKYGDSFQPDRASGLLPFGFNWTSSVWLCEYVAGTDGPGGWLIPGERHPQRSTWVGEYLDASEVAQALGWTAFPAGSPYAVAQPAPSGVNRFVSSRPPAETAAPVNDWPRLFGVLFVVLLGIAAIGFFFYSKERRTKPEVSHWFSCPAGPETPVIRIPRGIDRIVFDPHLPQGAIHYRLRMQDAAGAALSTHEGFVDMSMQKRVLEIEPQVAATNMVIGECTLPVPVAGLRSWPVEIRMYGPLLGSR